MNIWNIIDLILIILSCCAITIAFVRGYTKNKIREINCTEIVNGKIIEQRPYKFFGYKYFGNTLEFKYNETVYRVKKGLFGPQYENIPNIDIHINPNNPEECYLIPLSERCKHK